jgi:hypothetical protein
MVESLKFLVEGPDESRLYAFARAYASSLNATKAAMAIGMNETNARANAHRLLKAARPIIEPLIAARAAEISQARLLIEMGAIAFADSRSLLSAEGMLLEELPDDVARSIEAMRIDLDNGGRVLSVKFHNKVQAAAVLQKSLAALAPEVRPDKSDDGSFSAVLEVVRNVILRSTGQDRETYIEYVRNLLRDLLAPQEPPADDPTAGLV